MLSSPREAMDNYRSVLRHISRMVDPKLPWALKIYDMRLMFGDSALGKLDHKA
jgi:hypothetical protein